VLSVRSDDGPGWLSGLHWPVIVGVRLTVSCSQERSSRTDRRSPRRWRRSRAWAFWPARPSGGFWSFGPGAFCGQFL